MICGEEIEGEELHKINAAFAYFFEGQILWIEGHKTCLRNIWDLIIIPNRRAQLEWETNFKRCLREHLISEKKEELLEDLLKAFRVISLESPDNIAKG
jgi:predicted membrane chloride channel (bestrophin family)